MHTQRRKEAMAAIFKDVLSQQAYVMNVRVGVSDHVPFCLCVYILRDVGMCRAVYVCMCICVSLYTHTCLCAKMHM